MLFDLLNLIDNGKQVIKTGGMDYNWGNYTSLRKNFPEVKGCLSPTRNLPKEKRSN